MYICFILTSDFKSIFHFVSFHKHINRKKYELGYPSIFFRGGGGNLPPPLTASYDKLHILIVHQSNGLNFVAFILRTFSLIYNLWATIGFKMHLKQTMDSSPLFKKNTSVLGYFSTKNVVSTQHCLFQTSIDSLILSDHLTFAPSSIGLRIC